MHSCPKFSVYVDQNRLAGSQNSEINPKCGKGFVLEQIVFPFTSYSTLANAASSKT